MLRDLSTGGARLESRARPAIGSVVLLTLLPETLTWSRVVRHTADGFAVSFAPPCPVVDCRAATGALDKARK
jgi:hypothetical protein